MSFESLGLDEALVRALQSAGYENPTDVQSRAIPAALAGRDLRVCSNTGSGKTAAFVLPALMKVLAARQDPTQKPKKGEVRGPRILVLVPTRELCMQVAKAASSYGRNVPFLSVTSVVGGMPYPAQLKALRSPLDILIATPGRLIDHLGSGKAVLDNVAMLVLDEADRMLDMGFIEDIEHIAAALPAGRQTLMASATFAGEVGRLAQRLQKEDVERIEITGHTEKHESITQQLMWADDIDHKHALLDHLLTTREVDQAVVFTSTQIDADRLADRLGQMGHSVAALHGGMPQGRRNRVLQGLRSRHLRILVATDVASRGIDVPTITHVINYGLPLKAEDYVHRIGRTGRAGRAGLAVTIAERRDLPMIRRIQHYTTQAIPVATVEGLEPTRSAPDMSGRSLPRGGAPRGSGGFGGRSNHGGSGYGGNGGGYGGNSGGGYAGNGGGYAPRGGDFAHRGPRPERAPFERQAGGERAPFERPAFDRNERRPYERPADRTPFDRAPSARPPMDRPQFDRPQFDRPQFDRPTFDRPSFDRPADGPRGDAPSFRAPRPEGAPQRVAGAPVSASKPRFDSNGSSAAKRPRKEV